MHFRTKSFFSFQKFMNELMVTGLDVQRPLNVLAKEMISQALERKLPLTSDLGNQCIRCTSPLTSLSQMCGVENRVLYRGCKGVGLPMNEDGKSS
jgi:hypothetical protein